MTPPCLLMQFSKSDHILCCWFAACVLVRQACATCATLRRASLSSGTRPRTCSSAACRAPRQSRTYAGERAATQLQQRRAHTISNSSTTAAPQQQEAAAAAAAAFGALLHRACLLAVRQVWSARVDCSSCSATTGGGGESKAERYLRVGVKAWQRAEAQGRAVPARVSAQHYTTPTTAHTISNSSTTAAPQQQAAAAAAAAFGALLHRACLLAVRQVWSAPIDCSSCCATTGGGGESKAA
jgi:hypothetical protein